MESLVKSLEGHGSESNIIRRKGIPQNTVCPNCGLVHNVEVSGSMHYIQCQKNKGSRYLVGWDNVYMVDPPKGVRAQ